MEINAKVQKLIRGFKLHFSLILCKIIITIIPLQDIAIRPLVDMIIL